MVSLEMILSFYLYLISCFMFSYYHKHLLLMMISLEFMVIFMLFNMYMFMMMIEMNFYLLIYLMTMVVCEGVLGLSLIVLMVRFFGNDYTNSLMILKW